jgi:hypothetical protein
MCWAEHHSLLSVVQGEAAVEKFGTLLAPVATPIAAADTAEAVEAGKDVERVGSGHGDLLALVRVGDTDRGPRRN